MPDIDLDAIEARAKVASAGRLNWQGIDALRSLVESDVPALVALVRAKQSWIDGAKVDMAAMEEELAKVLAAIAAVRALHRPVPVQDECDHDDVSLCGGWETADGWFLCGPVLGHVCAECVDESGDHNVSHPCATVVLVDVPTAGG